MLQYMSKFELLKDTNYRYLQMANVINRLGDSIDAIALSWLIYQVSDSASLSALNMAINYLPTVILQPFMGAFVAKRSKQKMMMIADGGRGIIVALLAIGVLTNSINSWMILVATCLMSCFETFRLPSGNAIIPLIIDKDHYKNATSISSTLSRGAELIGSGIAGVIIGLWGMGFAILIDALSFIGSAFFISQMKVVETIAIHGQTTSHHLVNDFKEGLAYVRSSHALMATIVVSMLANMVLVPFNSLQSVFIDTVFSGNAMYLSVISVALTIGTLIGSSVFAFVGQTQKASSLILIVFPTCSFYYIAQLLCGWLNQPIWMVIGLALINIITGVIVGISNCQISVFAMVKTDPSYLSRVSALLNALGTAMIPITSLLVSLLASMVSVVNIFRFSGILMFGLTIFGYTSRLRRWLDE